MRVSDILARKDIRGVASVNKRETLTALVRTLHEKKLGALVVLDESGNMAGVISERDVVRALSERGDGALNDAVERHMTSDVVTATSDEDAVSVLEKMTAGRFRHMPVIHEGELIGVVSIGDLVKARIDALTRERNAMEEFIRS